ncbi:hypothetical protein APHAL10511_004071 [Amanita phalloides]|nr:hypothetical protein APHAL10511_004071 [Amanita phalloides]
MVNPLLFLVLLATLVFAAPPSSVGSRRGHRPSQRVTGGDAHNHSSPVEYSNNWSGAVWGSHPTGSFTSVTGTFKLPFPRSPDGAMSAWVGIDGDRSCPNTILQTGVDIYYNNTHVSYAAWYEWYPAHAVYLTHFPLGAGDNIRLTVTAYSATTGMAIVENLTNGQKVSQNISSSSPLCRQNAEWVVEDFYSNGVLVPVCNFGTVAFTDASATSISGPDMSPNGATIFIMQQKGRVLTSVSENSSGVTISYQ